MSESQPLLMSSPSPLQSPTKSIYSTNSNISTKDIVRIANQSVDEFLIEIESKRIVSDDSSLNIPTSPVTEPLNVEKNSFDSNLNNLKNYSLNGPKDQPIDSPKRSPKRVTIDSSPSKIHNYDADESDHSLEENSNPLLNSINSPWEKSSVLLSKKFENLPKNNKPLPKLKESLSIQSMPNLSYYSSENENENDNDNDSDQTLAPSPSPIHSATYISNRKLNNDKKNQFLYDHDNYMIDMKSGNLIESKDIKENIKISNTLKNDLLKSSLELSNLEISKKDLLNNFNLNDNDINRSDSIKSNISIKNTKLDTSLIMQQINENNPPNLQPIAKLSSTTTSNKNMNHTHKRSSSLSDFVGNIIRSFSNKSLNQLDPDPSADLEIDKTVEPEIKIENKNENENENKEINKNTFSQNDINDEPELISSDESIEHIESITVNTMKQLEDINPKDENNKTQKDSDQTIAHTENDVENSKIESTNINSSFSSDDFVLSVPFEDDIFDHEFDEFNRLIQSRNTSNSSNPSRISSIECAEKKEILEIWSKQKNFNNLPLKKHTDFDSINTPIKSNFKINDNHLKNIRILKDIPLKKRINSDECKPSSWIFKKLEILPNGINQNVKQQQQQQDGAKEEIKRAEEFESDENSEIMFIDESGNSVVHNEPTNNNFALDISINSNDSMDNSLLREIKNMTLNDTLDVDQTRRSIWSDMELNSKTHKPKEDSIEILKQVWNKNSISSLTHSDTFIRSNNSKNIEHYLNHKRIGSDEYHIKDANIAKINLQNKNDNQLLPVPQKATIYQFNNNNESFSKIVPQLGISEGFDFDFKDDGINYYDDDLESIHTGTFQQVDSLAFTHIQGPPKSPISPAREKMIAKFEQQLKQKEIVESHKILQQKLQEKIHQEAKIIESFYPKIELQPEIKAERRKDNFNDDITDIYETFENSPTKIPMIIPGSQLSFPESPIKNKIEEPVKNMNPFESPKVKKIFEQNIFKQVNDEKDNENNNKSLNPFDTESSNFDRISSITTDKKNTTEEGNLANVEQGRLFLRLNDINGLKLPNLKNRNAKFQLTLDNGIHCIKTDFITTGNSNSISINREFELIVNANLEIIITLKLKYDKLRSKTIEVSERREIKNKSMINKFMGKKEFEIIKKTIVKPPEDDPLSDYVASDGSFSKLKLNFDEYKEQIFAKPSTYLLTCFNEWKTTKSKAGHVENFKPIPICTLNMKMMFIPRKFKNEILPISIANAMAQLKEARKMKDIKFEGFMSQEGGDVDIWTKRFYKLENYDLFAYNLSNNKLKAKINLKKVISVSSPKLNSSKDSTVSERKRDFSDSDGLMLNNGFKVQFKNGEIIVFGCDTIKERDRWVNIMQELIAMYQFRAQPWLNTMLDTMKDVSLL
jgi:hypothetical protein